MATAVNFPSPPPPLTGSFVTSNPTLIILPAITILVLLIAIACILLYCREKSIKDDVENRSILHGSFRHGSFGEKQISLSKCSSDITATVIFSPDVRSCMYGGKLGFTVQERNRGAQVFTYKELELATEGFSESNVVGNGGFGVVFRGRLSDGTVAAIKKLHMDSRQGEREFRIEVDLLSRLHSPQLVGLLGYCADQHHRLLVFEFMPNGNLQQHLHQIPQQSLDWWTRLRIALDCARALEFLHEHSSPAVIHRDFKCSNVLLDRNFRAKVSDFGMAKIGSDKVNGQVLTRVLGTTGYLAPEYASTGRLTTKSDVYSYGVVLLQLLTGRVPVDTKRPPGEHVLVQWALPRLTNREKVMQMVDPTLKGQFSKKDLIQVAAIAAVCVQSEADYRPLMTDVVQSLIPLAVKTPGSSVPTTPLRPHEAM